RSGAARGRGGGWVATPRHDRSAPRRVGGRCGRPLVARYDLARIRDTVPRDALGRHGTDLWRYRALLPFAPQFPAVRLGEGGTPLLPLHHPADELGLAGLWVEEESPNPTPSFHPARPAPPP